MTVSIPSVRTYPPMRLRLSVAAGNLAQLAGLATGGGLLYTAANIQLANIVRTLLMIAGWAIIYLCCHSVAHWLVGRLGGIRFRGYGVRGTDHPEAYPPGLRQLMNIIPFFVLLTEKTSMARASNVSKALMFAAGELATTVFSVGAAWYATRQAIPGSSVLLIFSIVWNVMATIAVTLSPTGDYAKAIRALRGPTRGNA
jgi:hypothetical protein